VQDLGLVRLIKQIAPTLAVHGSTQMTPRRLAATRDCTVPAYQAPRPGSTRSCTAPASS
jgi:hypothetical protein